MPSKKIPNKLLLVSLALLITNFIWGAASPIIKFTLYYIPPFTFLFLRFLIACIILFPFTITKLIETKIPVKDYLNFFLLGLFSQTAIIFVFISLKYTTALDSTIISIITGILTVYAGHYFYKEKVHKRLQIGVFLVAIGTIFVIIEPLLSGNPNQIPVLERIFGNFLSFIYCLTWVLYVVWSKMSMGENSPVLKKTLSFIHIRPMSKHYSPTLIVAITMYIGLLTAIIPALLENTGYFGDAGNFNLLSLDPKGVVGLLYMAVFSSIVAYFLNQWALENGKVADSALFSYLSPVFAFPVSYLLLGELPTKFLLIGAWVIAIGVVIAESGNGSKSSRP